MKDIFQTDARRNYGVYFAADTAENVASSCLNKASSFFNVLNSNAYIRKLMNNWHAYHGSYTNDVGFGHSITFTGEQGELVVLPVNHFRNLAQHMLVMITTNRPAMEARAVNTDYKSLAQTYLANGILDYYMREKGLERCIRDATEMAVVLGCGYIKLDWNATGGDIYDVDEENGEFNYEGEIEFSNLSPLDVVVDGTKESWNNEWVIVRSFQNRFNLMAKYPELADRIKAIPSKSQSAIYRLAVFSNDDTDDIPVYEFYHKKTEALPDGRYMVFLDSDCVVLDTKLPYRTIPIFRISAGEILGTPYAYTPMFDVYPIQESINSLYSTIMTNQNAFGIQNIYVPRGADINVNSLDGAMNIIEGNAKPEPLNLTNTPAEVFKFLELMIQSAETISGINSVSRGNPEASLRSGSALALVQSMSIQFMSGLQNSYVKLIEDVGTGLLNILKDFATTPKVVALVGKNNRTYLKEFTGEQIKDINRVIVSVGNPLAKCLGKDTPVLMFDGSIKMVQDIKIGDEVMGPDSSKRTVSNVNTGKEMMYEITSKDTHRNVKYTCNESHILSLKYCSDDYRYDAKKGDLLDISVRDYLKLSSRQKRMLQGFKTGVDFDEAQVEIPPYILGAWLGDGHSSNTALTSMDKEVVNEWTKYASEIGMTVRIQENQQPNKSKVYFITSGQANGSANRNILMNHLKGYELIGNKHIPKQYLINSSKNRLELLAGLIDTDGTRIDQTLVITQKNDKLAKDIVFLSESLGFRTTIKKISSRATNSKNSDYSIYNKITIGGDTWKIPLRLSRKKCEKIEKSRDWLNYGISVTPIGEGTYYGFTLEEEPHFILGDFTVTHNTTAGRVQMAEQMLQMNLIKSPQEYFQVINTGSIETMYEGEMSELLLVKSENEKMLQGEKPLITALDDHKLHIQEHKSILSDPDLRQDPNLVQVVLAHIQEHIDLLRNTDPDLLALTGQQPLQPNPADGGDPSKGLPPGPQGNQGSPADMMQNPNRPPMGGDQIQQMGQQAAQAIPGAPRPPAPFQNMPISPSEVTPQ